MSLQRFYTTATTYSFVGTIRSDSYSLRVADYAVSDRAIYLLEGNDSVLIDNTTVGSNGYLYEIHLGSGNDTLSYNPAVSTYWVEVSEIHGGSGNDQIDAGTYTGAVYGGTGSDYLTAGLDRDSLYGDADNDTIDGGGGNDVLTGGSASDLIYGNTGDDYIRGDCDDREEQQLRFCDYIFTYAENEGGSDTIYAGDGNDLVVGGARVDEVYLGAGSDTVGFEDWDELGDRVTGFSGDDKIELINILAERDWDAISFGEIITTVQTGTGLQVYADVYGDNTKLLLVATLVGFQGTLDETQVIFGQCAVRDLVGSEVYGSALSEQITLLGYSASGAGGDDTITGNEDDNSISGGIGFDILFGGDGSDRLFGGSGNDTQSGGLGNDVLVAGAGADILRGDGGNDILIGGQGQDQMTGGAGADHFSFRSVTESSAVSASADVITDFLRGTDRINLSGIDAFAGGGTVNDTFLWRGTAAFSSTTAGEVRYQQFDTYTMVFVDTDADVSVEVAIRVNGLHSFTASDFVL